MPFVTYHCHTALCLIAQLPPQGRAPILSQTPHCPRGGQAHPARDSGGYQNKNVFNWENFVWVLFLFLPQIQLLDEIYRNVR